MRLLQALTRVDVEGRSEWCVYKCKGKCKCGGGTPRPRLHLPQLLCHVIAASPPPQSSILFIHDGSAASFFMSIRLKDLLRCH